MFFNNISKDTDDIVFIDKPKGITSFDVVRKLRKKLSIRKIGHAGTLDPLASGLMILGVGKGTKKLSKLIKLDKDYEAEIILGEKRTTGDLEGEVIESKEIEKDFFIKLKKENLFEKILNEMVGELNLPVPAFSAIKKGGERLYKKARRGEDVDTPIKSMKILSAKINKIKYKKTTKRIHVFVKLSVSSGSYIRSIAEEYGKRLSLPATLGNLRRTRVGEFDIKKAKKI